MTNIINILRSDVVPEHTPPEYVTEANSLNQKQEVLLYRRSISPSPLTIYEGSRFRIPLVPLSRSCLNHKTSGELKQELKDFVNECVRHIKTENHESVYAGMNAAARYLETKGTYIYHVLFSRDLINKIAPCLNYVSERKCIEAIQQKKTIMVLPEPEVAGMIALKHDLLVDGRDCTRIGMMLAKENAFAFTVGTPN